MPLSNILDPVHEALDPTVFDDPELPEPTFKQQHQHWIEDRVRHYLTEAGYTHIDNWLSLVLTGSLTTYQYSPDSDVDVSLFVDTEVFPDWSRAEIIGIMVQHMDGHKLPGTTHPMQCFVVPPEVKKTDLYQPGLRSGWDFRSRSWVVPPDRTRVHDVKKEMNSAYVMGLEAADKMEHLLRYEPDKAVQYWHQIHKRRQRDQKAGKGDYSDSNIVYKFLANRGLFPEISEVSGEYIAKTSGFTPYDGPRRFVVDKSAVRRAGRDLGLAKPVEVVQISGTYGTVIDQSDRYIIGVVGWLKPESASRQIWHELKHAQQIEQGITNFLTTDQVPYEEYAAQPAEQEARTWAEQQSEYPLTYDVRTAKTALFGIGEPKSEDFSYYRHPERLNWENYYDYKSNPGHALGQAAQRTHELGAAYEADQVTPERYESALDEIKKPLTERGIGNDLLPQYENGRTVFRPEKIYMYSPRDLTQKGWKPKANDFGHGSLEHLKYYNDNERVTGAYFYNQNDLYEVHNPGPMISTNHPYNSGQLHPAGKNRVAPENIRKVEPWELLPEGKTDAPSDDWSFTSAWPVVRKFVYDATTDRLIVGEEGPEEGVNLSHNQLCQQLGLEGLDELHGIAGTISNGWVQFEYQREQKGGNSAKVRYQAEQALKRQVPDIQGFLGGESSDYLKQLWQFSSVPEQTPEPTGTK